MLEVSSSNPTLRGEGGSKVKEGPPSPSPCNTTTNNNDSYNDNSNNNNIKW